MRAKLRTNDVVRVHRNGLLDPENWIYRWVLITENFDHWIAASGTREGIRMVKLSGERIAKIIHRTKKYLIVEVRK
jgi:hypothetical protein